MYRQIRDALKRMGKNCGGKVAGSLLICSMWLAPMEVMASGRIFSQAEIESAMARSPVIQVMVNGQMQNYPHKSFMIQGTTYVPLREVCESLGARVWWNGQSNTVGIQKAGEQMAFVVGAVEAKVNGQSVAKPQSFIINGKTMVPLRFISEVVGYHVRWNGSSQTVIIGSTEISDIEVQSLDHLKEAYTQEDLYWLSRIVHAEAESEPYGGKLAVANVILNRVKSDLYPNTIKEVIFDTNHGVQFQPISNGRIYIAPGAESIEAAKEALNGRNNAQDIMFFLNPSRASSFWISANRKFAFRLGKHNFYY